MLNTTEEHAEPESGADAPLDDAWRSGDPDDFTLLVRRYKDRIYAVVYRMLGNHEDAQEIAQEVFVLAYRNRDQFKGQSKVYTWLFRIAVNLCHNERRNRRRKGRDRGVSLEALQETAPGQAESLGAQQVTPRQIAEQNELETALQACLETLPDLYRHAFVLRIVDEQAYREIAETLNCPEGTIKSRLNQARRRLRDCLQANGVL